MKNLIGENGRSLRQKLHSLRQVAPMLEMDTTQLSKIEKKLRQLKREQIPYIAYALKANNNELMTIRLADQDSKAVTATKLANEAMQVADKNIKKKE